MGPVHFNWLCWPSHLLALTIAVAVPAMAQNHNNAQAPAKAPAATPAPTPTPAVPRVRFIVDGRLEGPSAMFLLPLERGYFKAAGLQVTIDESATPNEAIARVASGNYDMGFADGRCGTCTGVAPLDRGR